MAHRNYAEQDDTSSPIIDAMRHVRSMEREVLEVYTPLTASQRKIHHARASELLVRGGKRSSKTVCGMAEFCSRITGRMVTDMDGTQIPLKFPHTLSRVDDPKLFWIVGWDLKHIGQTLYPKMFGKGLFRVIKDEKTKKWRTYNPANPSDVTRKKESEPTEPLIPSRLIDEGSWSWYEKSSNTVKQVRLKNGATLCFYPSSAQNAKQGDPVDGILIDEDIQNPTHLDEYQDRLTDHDGWLMWTVWPHISNFALINLLDRAEDEKELDDPDVESVQLLMSENPMIPNSAKTKALKRMGDEESIARRDRGELLLDAISMYDFMPAVHQIQRIPKSHVEFMQKNRFSVLTQLWSEDGKFPDIWTRYASVDPSHTRTAVIFGVVPPPEVEGVDMRGVIVIEDELILTKATAPILAKAFKEKVKLKNYEAFIMDKRMGRQTRVGVGETVFEIYTGAFKQEKIHSRQTKYGFIPGLDVPTIRYSDMRAVLDADEEHGQPRLFVCEHCEFTLKEFTTYRKKQIIVNGEITIMDEPANPRMHDCMAATEYIVSYLLPLGVNSYVEPDNYGGTGSTSYRAAKFITKMKEGANTPYVHLGPGAAA